MKEHWDFLKESDTSFGLFYPLHYTMAAFDNLDRAQEAREAFLAAGFPADDVAAVSGAFVTDYLESEEGKDWFSKLRAGIARVIGTEAGYLDDDFRLGREGAAFLFVYTPDDEKTGQVHELIRRVQPVFARRYHHLGIESITYPPQSAL